MRWAAVIGSPIAHSLSPILHRAAWDGLGLPSEWRYERIETGLDDLGARLSSIDDDCLGLSVTMPCKRAVLDYCDAVDPVGAAVGAVNTLVPSAGILTGFNTDVHGIAEALREAIEAAGVTARRALVLGSGATAASALAALGTLGVAELSVAARRFGGPDSILAAASRLGVAVDQVMWGDQDAVRRAIDAADVVVSTLPAGVADDFARTIAPTGRRAFLDVVYAPRRTPLLESFENSGAAIAHGLDMLVHQAALQVRLMTGSDPDLKRMKAALEPWR